MVDSGSIRLKVIVLLWLVYSLCVGVYVCYHVNVFSMRVWR